MEEKNLIEKKKSINKKAALKRFIIPIIIVVLIVIIDQVTKIVSLNLGQINVIDNVLKIGVHENISPAYGIGNDSTGMFVITNLIIILVLAKFITSQNEFITMKIKIFLSLVIAGGISNVIDRLIRGYVLEFIDFSQISLPILNIADISIIIGWIGFAAVFAVFTVKEIRSNRQEKEVKKSVLEDKGKTKEKVKSKEEDNQ